jgi:hypothetical protein
MSSGTDISALYREFTNALTEVLAENAVGSARRGRLARAHAAVNIHTVGDHAKRRSVGPPPTGTLGSKRRCPMARAASLSG